MAVLPALREVARSRLAGRCHCGNVQLIFETDLPPEQLPLRACQCTFCRAHAALNTTDPAGSVEIVVDDAAELSRYEFGLRTAEFLICRRCGVYLAAVCTVDGSLYATINVNVLEDRSAFSRPAESMRYDGEDAAGRLARRKARWTPATLRIG